MAGTASSRQRAQVSQNDLPDIWQLQSEVQVTCATKRGRNTDLLNDFASYCIRHPDERFWQALRNWSGHNYIYVSEHQVQEFENPEDSMTVYNNLEETFYWEGRND